MTVVNNVFSSHDDTRLPVKIRYIEHSRHEYGRHNLTTSQLQSTVMTSQTSENMSQYTRIAAVTGSNKGIGLACVRQLALQYPKSSLNNGPLLVYLTARDEGRGKAALEDIQNDAQLASAKALRSQGGLTDIRYLPLDVRILLRESSYFHTS